MSEELPELINGVSENVLRLEMLDHDGDDTGHRDAGEHVHRIKRQQFRSYKRRLSLMNDIDIDDLNNS